MAKELPYINLVCNAKISETTKYSPYELMYGIKMNKFYNWNDTKEESVEIVKRTTQIKEALKTKDQKQLKIQEKQKKNKLILQTKEQILLQKVYLLELH